MTYCIHDHCLTELETFDTLKNLTLHYKHNHYTDFNLFLNYYTYISTLRINKIEMKMYFTFIRLPKMYVYVNKNNYALQKILMYIKEYLPPEYYKFICDYNDVTLVSYITTTESMELVSMKLVPVCLKITHKMVKRWEQCNKIYSDPRGIKPEPYYYYWPCEYIIWHPEAWGYTTKRKKKIIIQKAKYYYSYEKQRWITQHSNDLARLCVLNMFNYS